LSVTEEAVKLIISAKGLRIMKAVLLNRIAIVGNAVSIPARKPFWKPIRPTRTETKLSITT